MDKNRFKSVFFTLAALALLCLSACLPPAAAIGSDTTAEVANAARNIDNLAQVTAACLAQNPEMLAVIRAEIAKNIYGGGGTALYGNVKNAILSGGHSMQQALCAFGAAGGTSAGAALEEKISQVERQIFLQMYMPNYAGWDGSTPPLVASFPLGQDDMTCHSITAYDAAGTACRIDASNISLRPLLILGYWDVCGTIMPADWDMTATAAQIGSGGNTQRFKQWSLSANASIGDRYSTTTFVTNFESDLTVTALYESGPLYTLTVNRMLDNGTGERTTDTYDELRSTSQVGIYTPGRVEVRDGNGTLQATHTFTNWSWTGPVSLADPNNSATTATGFTGNASVTANYSVTYPPRVYYSVSINYRASDGSYCTEGIYPVEERNVVSLNSPAQIAVNGQPYHFTSWSLSGTATIANTGSASTTVTGFKSNVTITAQYVSDAGFTVRVGAMRFNSDGSSYYDYSIYENIPAGGELSINATDVFYPVSPNPMLYFDYWSWTGNAAIDNPGSSSVTLRNIQSDVTVTPYYHP
jgi:outer membrane lipoprotein SlyB